MPRQRDDDSRRKWWFVVALVLLFHLAVLIFVRPGYFHFLLRDISPPASSGSRRSATFAPDAIIAIKVDVEKSDDVEPTPEQAATVSKPVSEPHPSAKPGDQSNRPLEGVDIGEIIDQAGKPRAGGGAPPDETIAPRPIEITWPETRRLKHCIGRHVDVRILVGEDGKIQKVEPQPSDLPPDCLRSALDAARKIRFEPGRVDGKPATLWAQVRIDFEEKR